MIAVKEDGAAPDYRKKVPGQWNFFLHCRAVNHRKILLSLWQAITNPRAGIGYDVMS